MSTEIEAKLRIESPQAVERKLTQLGAEFVAEQSHIDYHFDDEGLTLSMSDSALRLRRQSTGENIRSFLTYKGPKEKSRLKRRREIETEIEDPDVAAKILRALGYRKMLTIEKRRRLWRFGQCEVALDSLPLLGDFVEIEGPSEDDIRTVQESLGLSGLQHIPRGYAAMIAQKLREPGRQQEKDPTE